MYSFYCFPSDINISEPGEPCNHICCPWKYKLTLFLHSDVYRSSVTSIQIIQKLNLLFWTELYYLVKGPGKRHRRETDKLLIHHKQLSTQLTFAGSESHSYSLPFWVETKDCDICALKANWGLTAFELLPLYQVSLKRIDKGGSTGRRTTLKWRDWWWIEHLSCRRKHTYSKSWTKANWFLE